MKLIKYHQLHEYKIRIGYSIMPLRTDNVEASFTCNSQEEMECEIKRIEEKTKGAVFIDSVEDISF